MFSRFYGRSAFDKDPTPWGRFSYFMELRPTHNISSLYVDCPRTVPTNASKAKAADTDHAKKQKEPVLFVEFEENELIICTNDDSIRVSALFDQLKIQCHTVSHPNWVDYESLLTFKLHCGMVNGPLRPKTHVRIMRSMCSLAYLQQFAESYASADHISLLCSWCATPFVKGDKNSLTLNYMPTDNWLVSPNSVEHSCRETCGAACEFRCSAKSSETCTATPNAEWLPTKNKMVVSFAYVHVDRQTISGPVVVENDVVSCGMCLQNIGIVDPAHDHIYRIHHTGAILRVNETTYMQTAFTSFACFLTSCMLTHCESDGTHKVVVRNFQKTPEILLWLLDSYVVNLQGVLEPKFTQSPAELRRDRSLSGDSSKSSGSEVSEGAQKNNRRNRRKKFSRYDWALPSDDSIPMRNVYPALKVMYKIFSPESAMNDPRAVGGDSSVEICNMPKEAVERLSKILLRSTASIPPTCRCVGQFFVGYLPLEDRVLDS